MVKLVYLAHSFLVLFLDGHLSQSEHWRIQLETPFKSGTSWLNHDRRKRLHHLVKELVTLNFAHAVNTFREIGELIGDSFCAFGTRGGQSLTSEVRGKLFGRGLHILGGWGASGGLTSIKFSGDERQFANFWSERNARFFFLVYCFIREHDMTALSNSRRLLEAETS